ncbi:MAG: hypothetical protein H7226_06150 [Salinibacterium sp.]|nr:hypothetical protein [Salinibacterium sp.]
MGQLLYGSPPETFVMDDRTLAHLEIVTLAKLRRNESFALSLDRPEGGRTTVWLAPASTIVFRFDENSHEVNRVWLEVLLDSANTTAGMRLLSEPESVAP